MNSIHTWTLPSCWIFYVFYGANICRSLVKHKSKYFSSAKESTCSVLYLYVNTWVLITMLMWHWWEEVLWSWWPTVFFPVGILEFSFCSCIWNCYRIWSYFEDRKCPDEMFILKLVLADLEKVMQCSVVTTYINYNIRTLWWFWAVTLLCGV